MPKTRPVITKYELTKVLAARVQQLADGAQTTLPRDHPAASARAPLAIALAELDEHVLPMMIPTSGCSPLPSFMPVLCVDGAGLQSRTGTAPG